MHSVEQHYSGDWCQIAIAVLMTVFPLFLPQHDDVLIFGCCVGCMEDLDSLDCLESIGCSIGRMAKHSVSSGLIPAASLLIWPEPWHKKSGTNHMVLSSPGRFLVA